MPTKEQVLGLVRQMSANHEISEGEVMSAYRAGAGLSANESAEEKASKHNLSVSKILYIIGGFVVLIGIIILIVQRWSDFNSFTQVLITLGVAIVAYITSLLIQTRKELNIPAQVFAAISGVLFPIGLSVLFHNLDVDVFTAEMNITISLIALVIFGVSLIMFRQAVFALFSIIYGSWLYAAFIALIIRNLDYSSSYLHIPEYSIMILGLAYLFIGYTLSKNANKEFRRLSLTLYSFGTVALLAPGLAIGGGWDLFYPVLLFAVMFTSVYIRSSSFLRIGAFFLMAYLIKMSAEYFSNSLGWSLSLVLAGLLLMGVGYLTYYLNKKYIKGANENIRP